MAVPERKSVTINMRCPKRELWKIDRAAEALGVSRSEFIRSAAEDLARKVVLKNLRRQARAEP